MPNVSTCYMAMRVPHRCAIVRQLTTRQRRTAWRGFGGWEDAWCKFTDVPPLTPYNRPELVAFVKESSSLENLQIGNQSLLVTKLIVQRIICSAEMIYQFPMVHETAATIYSNLFITK